MLRNYLKVALRALRKQKAYAVINIGGLAVGMACCLLIALVVRHEWSFDRFHERGERIYRTTARYVAPDGEVNYQNMMFPEFTPALEAAFPGIEAATRLVAGQQDVAVGDRTLRHALVEVDAAFFSIFSFPFHAGDPATALRDPGGAVLTETAARSLYGVDDGTWGDALGRTFTISRDSAVHTFEVTGVAEDPPPNSSIGFEIALSFEQYGPIQLGGNNWGGRTSTYILLAEGQTPDDLEAALVPFVNEQFASYQEELRENDALGDGPDAFRMHLQPLHRLHLEPDVWAPYETSAHDPVLSLVLGSIAALILLIACINFMTLSVGRSAGRAREVGLRKVLGARRRQLMGQFWGEALVMTAAALVLAVALAALALPAFNDLTGRSLSLVSLGSVEVFATLGVLLVLVAVVAGGYPAALLSGYRPAAVFRGEAGARGNTLLTRSLVVVQYAISIALLVGTIVVARQLDHLLNRDLGFEDEHVLVVDATQVGRSAADRVLERMRERLLPTDGVTHVARAGYSFTRGSDRNTWTDADGITRSAYNFGVDFEYLDLMEMELAAGRNFSRERPTDPTHAVLVNEALVREFGIEDPVGKQLTGWLSWIYDTSPTIIGVVEDYNFRSLHEAVQPTVLNMHPGYYSYMGAVLVKLRPDVLQAGVRDAEAAWAEAMPGKPFNYSFLDDDLAQQYVSEARWSAIVQVSAGLAILIACLGLFGLATLSVARRTKEIGIRKVLGASVPGVVGLVVREFVVLVAVATLAAWPLAYVALRGWLDDFAYRVPLAADAFVAAAGAALAVAVLTVAYHAVRAALSDPVDALRYE